MKKLLGLAIIITIMEANQQAFQQGYNGMNKADAKLQQVEQAFNYTLSSLSEASRINEQIYEQAKRLNPKTLEGCKQILFATEFCIVNFNAELKEALAQQECARLAINYVKTMLQYGNEKGGEEYRAKKCERFVPKVAKETK